MPQPVRAKQLRSAIRRGVEFAIADRLTRFGDDDRGFVGVAAGMNRRVHRAIVSGNRWFLMSKISSKLKLLVKRGEGNTRLRASSLPDRAASWAHNSAPSRFVASARRSHRRPWRAGATYALRRGWCRDRNRAATPPATRLPARSVDQGRAPDSRAGRIRAAASGSAAPRTRPAGRSNRYAARPRRSAPRSAARGAAGWRGARWAGREKRNQRRGLKGGVRRFR